MKQKEALDILKLGHNVFVTGFAGSGKTHLLNEYISYLRNKDICVGITATTGIAASHIEGITLNSWSGVGIKNQLAETDLMRLSMHKSIRERIKNTQVLIIDEVSMLSQSTFENTDKICRYIRKNNLPFGGLQIVLAGDFFQLSPVAAGKTDGGFIYKTELWKRLNLTICYLDISFRHRDGTLFRILRELRNSKLSSLSKSLLNSRLRHNSDDGEPSSRLYTHNINAENLNNLHLIRLKSEPHVYMMQYKGSKILADYILKSSPVPEVLVLKKKALVMFLKNNNNKGYVNGSVGEVVGFSKKGYPKVAIRNGRTVTVGPEYWSVEVTESLKTEIKQIPLKLAWAITIHKSQGMTLDSAVIDLSKTFSPGMGYVALSRVKTLKGIRLVGLNSKALEINKEVMKIDKKFKQLSEETQMLLKNLEWLKKQTMQSDFVRKMRRSQKKIQISFNLLPVPVR